jgi:UDP-glucose 4-epimerase
VHVDDLSRAHLDILPKLEAPGQALFYNLGTGTPYSVKDVIASVGRILGRPVPHEFAPRREGDPPALYADASKARRELGWSPRYATLDDIVRTACAWHLAHPAGFAS